MNVLMITIDYPPFVYGGIGRHVEELMKALRFQGINVTVLTMYKGNATSGENSVIYAPKFLIDEGEPTWILEENISLGVMGEKLIQKDKFDIVHYHDIYVAQAAHILAFHHNLPTLLTKHMFFKERGLMPTNFNGIAEEKTGRKYLIKLERWSIRNAQRIIAVSNAVKNYIRTVDCEAEEKCTVVYNGTNIANYLSQDSLATFQKYIHRPNSEKILLLVGRIRLRKGHDLAIRALSILKDLPLKLVIIGTGDYQEELEQLTTEIGVQDKVRFLGHIEGTDLADLYYNADIVIVPSRYEPFGLTVAEGLALGKPVIAAAVGGIVEQIDNLDNGLLFKPDDADDLARCIRWAFHNPDKARQLGERAAKRARTMYNWISIADQTIKQYEILLSQNRY